MDIPLENQVCQLAHAAHEAGIHLSKEKDKTSSIVICGLPNESSILKEKSKIEMLGIRTILFREPDINNEATAFATEPITGTQRNPFSKYRLWRYNHAK